LNDLEILPETIFNIQSSGNADARISGATAASVQLLTASNNLTDGAEFRFSDVDHHLKVSRFESDVKSTIFDVDVDNHVAIGGDGPIEKVTIFSDNDKAIVAMQETDVVVSSSQWGKFYIKEYIRKDQTQGFFFMDDAGNEFNLTHNIHEAEGDSVYTDANKNTYVGDHSPADRTLVVTNGQFSNTTLGYEALNAITTGDHNTAVGEGAGKNITSGARNTLIGKQAGTGITTGDDSVILGSNMAGNNDDDQFLVGTNGENYLSGSMTGTSKTLTLHKGTFAVTSPDGLDNASVTYNGIRTYDSTNLYPDHQFVIDFAGTDEFFDPVQYDFWTFDHSVAPMSNTPTWPAAVNPYAQLEGDLRVRGSVVFADGTSLNSLVDTVVEGGIGTNKTTGGGNSQINLDIESLDLDAGLDAAITFLPVSQADFHFKLSLANLKTYMSALDARITGCSGGYNYLFTNNSTFDGVCNSVFMGSQAGHLAVDFQHTTFMGTQAGYNATTQTGGDAEHGSAFIGLKSGKNSVDCYASTFIGPSSGEGANASYSSTFIGDQAGMNAQSNRSIGIGDNALEGVIGSKNLELTTGVGGALTSRLIQGTHSNKMNLGDTIGSEMDVHRVSIGAASVNSIGSTLDVRPSTNTEKVQKWMDYNGVEIAYLDQSGNLHIAGSVIQDL
jgi:hypothetical protein